MHSHQKHLTIMLNKQSENYTTSTKSVYAHCSSHMSLCMRLLQRRWCVRSGLIINLQLGVVLKKIMILKDIYTTHNPVCIMIYRFATKLSVIHEHYLKTKQKPKNNKLLYYEINLCLKMNECLGLGIWKEKKKAKLCQKSLTW